MLGVMANEREEPVPLHVRFRIQLPEEAWISEVSRSFPSATFRLLTGFRTSTGAIELGEVEADDPGVVGLAIADHSEIVSYQRLDVNETRSLARYETSASELYEFVDGSSVAPEYPIVVRNGWFEYDLTATREEFEAFRSRLEGSGLDYELRSKVRYVRELDVLTDRQRRVLDAAHRAGYFEVPRECTLAELAASLEIDKSTASEILRRAEARLVARYLAGSD